MSSRTPVDVAIAIWDPIRVRAHRLREVLDSYGLRAATPSDVRAWSATQREPIVIVGVVEESQLGLVADLSCQRSADRVRVIARPPAHSTGIIAEVIAAGATVVVPRELPAAHVAETVWELLRGRALMPLAILDAIYDRADGDGHMSSRPPARPPGPSRTARLRLTDRHCQLLQLLADGWTVGQIGAELGRSRRQLHRDLRGLYRRLRVDNRSQAIAVAAASGLVDLASCTGASR